MSPIIRRCLLSASFGLAAASSPLLAGPPPFVRTNLVSGAGTALANGAALLSAVATAAPNGCAASNRRWLVRLEPGIFNLGSSGLVMKNCVDIEGSGRDVTTILSQGSPSTITWGAGITAEVRNLTIQNSPPSGQTFAVTLNSSTGALSRVNVIATGTSTVIGVLVSGTGTSPVLSDVAVTASSTANTQSEFVYGLYFNQSTPLVNNVKISIASPNTDNTGIYEISGAAATVDGGAVTVSGGTIDIGIWVSAGCSLNLTRGNVNDAGQQAFGIEDEGGGMVEIAYSVIVAIASNPVADGFGIRESVVAGTVVIQHSTIEGSGFSIADFPSPPLTNRVAMSQLVNPVYPPPGTPFTCVGAYNQSFTLLNGHCL
jgi:hypothetical protein